MLDLNILVTGGSGFVGKNLLSVVGNKFLNVYAPIRDNVVLHNPSINLITCADITRVFEFEYVKPDVVIHLAGLAHNYKASNEEIYSVNFEMTLSLVESAAKCGVKRFIFLSSVNVLGESSVEPFTINSPPNPASYNAMTKLLAEKSVMKVAQSYGMEFVIIRAPLVYGYNAPANFGHLISLAKKSLPLPFGRIKNKRSFISVDNLVDFIVTCIVDERAANQVFLVSDGLDLSTTELLNLLKKAADKSTFLIPIPVWFLNAIFRLIGKKSLMERLCGNFQVDITHSKNTLGWRPPVSVEDGIRRCFYSQGN